MVQTRRNSSVQPSSSSHRTEEKLQLRKAIKERLDRLPENKRQAESRTLCRELLPHIPKGSVVCAYFPLKTEASVRPLLQKLLARGDKVFLPCYANKRMICRQMFDEESLIRGELTIPEPSKDAPLLDLKDLDIALIPGRAFDAEGGRLGRRSGGYDRWIAKFRKANPHGKLVGIALECQLVQQVPLEPHDQPMDAIVTARGYKEIA